MRREVVGHIPGNDGRRWTIDTTLKLFGFDGAFGTESRVLIADWQGVGSYMELWNGVTDQMENLVQENGGRKLVVVGHSAGGIVGVRLLVERPDLVSGVWNNDGMLNRSPHMNLRGSRYRIFNEAQDYFEEKVKPKLTDEILERVWVSYTWWDGLIRPASAVLLVGANEEKNMVPLHHISLMWALNPRFARRIMLPMLKLAYEQRHNF